MRDCSKLPIIIAILLQAGCEPAEDVRVQELPSLARSSVESRLGLPEVSGAWRFAGWELEQGDTLGLGAELPGFGILWLQAQKRDSLAGYYVVPGGRAPLYGEVRRDRVVSLVTFPAPGDGRYLVGEVAGDTLWVESTSLAVEGSWRGDARAAFVRSQGAVTPFRRVRGFVPPPPPDTVTRIAAADSLAPIPGAPRMGVGATGVTTPSAGARPPAAGRPGIGQPGAVRPTLTPRGALGQPSVPPVTDPSLPPVTEPEEAEEAEETEEVAEEPEPEPVVEREPPRVIGVPVVRDTAGGG